MLPLFDAFFSLQVQWGPNRVCEDRKCGGRSRTDERGASYDHGHRTFTLASRVCDGARVANDTDVYGGSGSLQYSRETERFKGGLN